jgi:hypothetical protein
MDLRPELIMQRTDLKQKQLELIREKNGMLPDIRAGANYNIHGAGDTLDGNASFASGLSTNALRILASDHFNDFSAGLYGSVPIGYRAQNAAVRAAKLRLAQSYLQLRDQEERARRYLVQQYRAVIQDIDVIQARHQQRLAFAQQVEARFQEFVAGKTTADFLLQAQRDWANAVTVEYQSIVEYNNALVRFQFAKGTLIQFNGIQIAEGPLPQCVQVRAVENERQRAKAIALREEAYGLHEFPSGNPILPEATAAALPILIKSTPPDAFPLEESVPLPRPQDSIPGLPPTTLPPATSTLPAPSRLPATSPVSPGTSLVALPAAPTVTQQVPPPPATTLPNSTSPNFTPPTMVPPAPVVPSLPRASTGSTGPTKSWMPDDGLR